MSQDFPLAKIVTKKVDVTNAGNVARIMSEARTELGSIDILLCFAGVICTEPALDVSPELFRRTIDVNTTGSFLCAQAAAR
jgi:NAD(P)-dependent dehydrogenase (short-subunit alcohol dehydrogenase family)